MKYCPACNTEYDDDIDYCEEDGRALRTRTKPEVSSPEEEKQVQPTARLSSLARSFCDKITGYDSDNIPNELKKDVVKMKSQSLSAIGYDEMECQLLDKDENYTYRRFRLGALTTDSVYSLLRRAACCHIPELYRSGLVTILNDGTQLDFELTKQPQKQANTLEHWLSLQPASEDKATELLQMLVELVTACIALQVLPISLSPTDLLVLDGTLKLRHLGAIMQYSDEVHFRKEIDSSPLLARPYSDPELTDANALYNNALIFSVGQLLCTAIWGEAFAYTDIKQGRIPFGRINNAWLATVIMGCLWPEANGRLSLQEFNKITSDRLNAQQWPDIKNWQSLNAQNAECIAFAGRSFFTAKDLLRCMVEPQNWDQALLVLPQVYQWLTDHTNYGSAVALSKNSDRTSDWQLIALVRTICPEMPATWRTLSLDDNEFENSFIKLGQAALNEDKDAQQLVDKLFEADLRDLP